VTESDSAVIVRVGSLKAWLRGVLTRTSSNSEQRKTKTGWGENSAHWFRSDTLPALRIDFQTQLCQSHHNQPSRSSGRTLTHGRRPNNYRRTARTGEGNWPIALLGYVASESDKVFIITEVCESREARGAFMTQLGPAIHATGLPEPRLCSSTLSGTSTVSNRHS